MDDEQAFNIFRDCAVEVLAVQADQVRPDARFADDLDADSLDLLELALAVEEALGITVPEEDLREIETVEQAFAVVRSRLLASVGDAQPA
jgi:acyl carrier protein